MRNKLKILAIGDMADNLYILKKFAKDFEVHLINFPGKGTDFQTNSNVNIEFFNTMIISKQVDKIRGIKNNFDLCIVMTWAGARIAYLAGLNYIMYFTGGDITAPPFKKNLKTPENPFPPNLSFIERKFYWKVFKTAIACVAPFEEYFNPLKKYRKDAIRLDKMFVDTELFNKNIPPKKLEKKKFTFLSPTRITLGKGTDILWEALKLCKTDFEVLQTEYFMEETAIENISQVKSEENKKLLNDMPTQIKLIPLINRQELGSYYRGVDAILGQWRCGVLGGIEKDASFCKVPILCYIDPKKPWIIDEKEMIPPYYPRTREPIELAELIDKMVTSKEFREETIQNQFEFIQKVSSPENVEDEWHKIFKNILAKCKSINRNSNFLLCIEMFMFRFYEKYVIIPKYHQKNINVWGKIRYEELFKYK